MINNVKKVKDQECDVCKLKAQAGKSMTSKIDRNRYLSIYQLILKIIREFVGQGFMIQYLMYLHRLSSA